MSLRSSSGLVTVPSVIGSSGAARTFSAKSGFQASTIRDADPTCSGTSRQCVHDPPERVGVGDRETVPGVLLHLEEVGRSLRSCPDSLEHRVDDRRHVEVLRAVGPVRYPEHRSTAIPVRSSRPWATATPRAAARWRWGSRVAPWSSPERYIGMARERLEDLGDLAEHEQRVAALCTRPRRHRSP